jgi:hypothetical protein
MEIIGKEVHFLLVQVERAERRLSFRPQASNPSSITVDVSMSRTVWGLSLVSLR